MAHTANLTENQQRVLAIVEAGGDRGVAIESIEREERTEGRSRSGVWDTVFSLQRRGLVEVEATRVPTLGQYGTYLREVRRVRIVKEA